MCVLFEYWSPRLRFDLKYRLVQILLQIIKRIRTIRKPVVYENVTLYSPVLKYDLLHTFSTDRSSEFERKTRSFWDRKQ